MKKNIFTVLSCTFLLLFQVGAYSQAIDKGCFSIKADGYFRYFSIVQTYDGNYVVGGLEYGFDGDLNENFWVFKIDAAANILWSSSIGTTALDVCYRLLETADHKIVAAGFASAGDQNLFIVKYEEDGTIIWQKNIDPGQIQSYAKSIVEASDGGYVLAGVAGSDGFVIKLDANGNKIWSTKINDNGFYDVIPESVVSSASGGYLVSGWGISNGGFFTHLSEGGTVQWSVTYYAATPYDAVSLPGGAYLISGYETGAGQPHANAFVAKIDGAGEKEWSKTYGDDGSETFYGLHPTNDGGFIGVGASDTGAVIGTAAEHGFVVKCNSSGDVEWSKKVNSVTFLEDVIQIADGGFMLLGNSIIVKVDAEGNGCDQCLLENFGSGTDAGDLTPYIMYNEASDDSIFNSSFPVFSGGTTLPFCTEVGIMEAPAAESLLLFPNPSSTGIFKFEIPQLMNMPTMTVTDIFGRKIFGEKIAVNVAAIDLSSYPKGMYLLDISDGAMHMVSKIMYE